MLSEHREVIRAIEPAVADNLRLLLPLDKSVAAHRLSCPDLETASWRDEVEGFRDAAEAVSDELLVVLVGDMVTEEALPSYSVALNGLVKDDEGTSPAPWARWLRGWTAEENRHGDLLNAYLRLTGRVDMRAVERTIHDLVANGFNPRTQRRSLRPPRVHGVSGARHARVARQRRADRRQARRREPRPDLLA